MQHSWNREFDYAKSNEFQSVSEFWYRYTESISNIERYRIICETWNHRRRTKQEIKPAKKSSVEKGAEFNSSATTDTNANSSNASDPAAAKQRPGRVKAAKAAVLQSTGGKAKSKTNKVTEDYQGRLEQVESFLACFVDIMEQPVDDIDTHDYNDRVVSENKDDKRNYYLPLVQENEPKSGPKPKAKIANAVMVQDEQ